MTVARCWRKVCTSGPVQLQLEIATMAGIKDYVGERAQGLAEQAGKLRKTRADAARKAAARSAAGLKSLKEPVRSLSRSSVKLTSISQGTAQRLIELQERIVTSALDDAAAQLERAAATDSVREVVADQARVLMAARERIVADMSEAIAILKDAGQDARRVAGQPEPRAKSARKKVRKTARKKAAGRKNARPAAARGKAPARKKGRAKVARRKAKRTVRKTAARARRAGR